MPRATRNSYHSSLVTCDFAGARLRRAGRAHRALRKGGGRGGAARRVPVAAAHAGRRAGAGGGLHRGDISAISRLSLGYLSAISRLSLVQVIAREELAATRRFLQKRHGLVWDV